MHTVMLADNPLDSGSYRSHVVEHVGEFLCSHFEARWPETARIYRDSVSKENDVTPGDEEAIEALESYNVLWVIVYPATGVEVAIVIGVVALAASIAAILLIPSPPKTQKEKAALSGSPTNSLTDRSNVARPNQRIPDNFGVRKSVPDLVMVPYITYVNHRQTEIGLYCVGRGDHTTTAADVRDGATRIDQIDQASAHVYSPGNAPTGVGPFSGDILAIGDPIDDPALNVYQIKAVNGQNMEALNAKKLYGAAKKPDVDGDYDHDTVYNFFNIMAFQYLSSTTGIIHVPYLQATTYVHDRVSVGDLIFISFDPFDIPNPVGSPPKPGLQTDSDEPFTNAPTVTSITDAGDYVELGISIPTALAAEWAKIPAYVAALSGVGQQSVRFGTSFDAPYAEIVSTSNIWVGPFFVDFLHPVGSSDVSVLVNFVAPAGAYVDDGKSVKAYILQFEIGITPCNSSGVPTAGEAFFTATLEGSDLKDGTRAISTSQLLGINSRFLIRARRLTNKLRREELPQFVESENYPDLVNIPNGQRAFTGTIQDEVRWTQAYTRSVPPNISFGDVTLVHTRTVNTDGATNNQDRSLNLLVQRKINQWNGTAFTGPTIADGSAENVLFTLMKDPFIGNRPDAEIDFAGIAACFAGIRAYFDNSGVQPTQVSVTLDDDNMSFEETVIAIASMSFGVLYRLGNVIKAKPEIATAVASLAFNHRNILPGTQKITHTFGPPTENDSVQVDYVDPTDSTITQVTIPFNGPSLSPLSVKMIGLGTRIQAIWQGYRAYQKILFQRQALEMQTTGEAVTAIVKDRILVADVTQFQPQSGEVVQATGLNLKLSQKPVFTFGKTYTIFLMHPDGTVEGIPITAGSGFFDVVLGSAPASSIITDPTAGVPTIYNIIQDDESMPSAYLVSEMSAQDNHHINVQGINYSDMYYFADSLDTWIKDRLQDYSAFERALTNSGSLSQVTVAPRGTMLSLSASSSITYTAANPGFIDVLGPGYTFFAWVKHTSQPGALVGIVETVGTPEVIFGFANDVLVGSQQGTLYNVSDSSIASGVLHSVALTYDANAGRMALFRNGVLVSSATGVIPLSTPLSWQFARSFQGQFGDISVWKRCWSDRAIFELHTKTLIL